MATGTVVDVYERYVRPLSPAEQHELLALIVERLTGSETAIVEPPPRGIRELHGVGRASWDGSDAQEFVNRLREEWDERT
jgi:hypothetical protein